MVPRGSGSFAVVRDAERIADGTSWAVKVITKSRLTEDDRVGLETEIAILKSAGVCVCVGVVAVV